MSKNKEFQRVFSKNYMTMNSIVWLKADLLMSAISDIRKEFGINKNLPTINPMDHQAQYGTLIKQGSQKMKTFHERIGNKASDFYADLEKITKQLHLGREWITPLEKFAISGIFLPPPFSVFVDENEDKKTIIFELNKNTTRDDLILAWKNIEDIRKRMFGKVRANFPTKKGIDNFRKITALKLAGGDEEVVVGAVAGDKKYKKRKADIIADIYSDEDDISEEADKKRLNKLKTAEHRLRKVTS